MRSRRPKIKVNKAGNFYRTIRLPDGRFINIHLSQSSSTDLIDAKPQDIWTTGDGRQLLPKDMDLNHLLNVKKTLMERTQQAMGYHKISVTDIEPRDFAAQLWPVYTAIDNEIQYRLGTKERPEDKPAAVLPRRKLDLEL